jgi:hypothetical protein
VATASYDPRESKVPDLSHVASSGAAAPSKPRRMATRKPRGNATTHIVDDKDADVLTSAIVQCDASGPAGDPRRVLSAAVSHVARGGDGRAPMSARALKATVLVIVALAMLAIAASSMRSLPHMFHLVRSGNLDDTDARGLESEIAALLEEMTNVDREEDDSVASGSAGADAAAVTAGADAAAETAGAAAATDGPVLRARIVDMSDPRVAAARFVLFAGLLLHLAPSILFAFEANYVSHTAPLMVATWSDTVHRCLAGMAMQGYVGFVRVKALAGMCLVSLALSALGIHSMPGDLVAFATTGMGGGDLIFLILLVFFYYLFNSRHQDRSGYYFNQLCDDRCRCAGPCGGPGARVWDLRVDHRDGYLSPRVVGRWRNS